MKITPIGSAIVLVLAAGLSGCSANWKVGASCDTTKKCEVHGEISGTLPPGPSPSFASAMLAASEPAGAAQFVIDITGSTVAYPATGTVTIFLINSSNGATQAAKLFPWTRTGNLIRLTDPNAVNNWVAVSGGSADKMTCKLTRFQSDYGIGGQTLAVASVYEGSTNATATSSFESCAPRGVHTPYPCSQ